jgi:hypothetical protein
MIAACTACCACWTAEQPTYSEVIVLEGTAYERGVAHGKHFSSKIRSLYTGLLTSSLLPYLNRLQPDLASVLAEYQKPLYANGQFSYQVMLQSGKNLVKYIPQEYLDEMHGVADGAGLPFEQILILNTFMDTLLELRSLSFFINSLQSPYIEALTFEGMDSDGQDNNGDLKTDEADEGEVSPYGPSPYAIMTEVPGSSPIKIRLRDKSMTGKPKGVNQESVRIQLDKDLYVYGDPSIVTNAFTDEKGDGVDVLFTPPGGLSSSTPHSFLVQAGNLNWITEPPPAHYRYMRDERFTISIKGYGKAAYEVNNSGEKDGHSQPPSTCFALRDSATKDGNPLAAQHFSMLDSNVSHKHTALFVIKPKNGTPHAYVGWAGLVWGFSGMNTNGVVYMVDSSDTLDNPMTKSVRDDFLNAKLLASGTPIGLIGREILNRSTAVKDGLDYIRSVKKTYGWNILLSDSRGGMTAVEVDSDIFDRDDHGVFPYTPDVSDPANLDQWGRPWASIGKDDLRMAAHFRKNYDDVNDMILIYKAQPQRYWTSFYYRSVRAYYQLGDLISGQYGKIGPDEAEQILSNDDLVDTRDSMNAVVYMPKDLKMRYAMGQEPATSGPFVEFDLKAAVEKGVSK